MFYIYIICFVTVFITLDDLLYQESNAILTGDCVLGCGSSVFEDLSVYLKSLHKLQQVMECGVDGSSSQPMESIYPG